MAKSGLSVFHFIGLFWWRFGLLLWFSLISPISESRQCHLGQLWGLGHPTWAQVQLQGSSCSWASPVLAARTAEPLSHSDCAHSITHPFSWAIAPRSLKIIVGQVAGFGEVLPEKSHQNLSCSPWVYICAKTPPSPEACCFYKSSARSLFCFEP